LPACSTSSTPISIDITAGQETTAFVDSGATECSITVQSLDGTIDETVTAAPGKTFDMPTDIPNDEQVYVTVVCTAEDGSQVMAGESLSGLLLSAVTSGIPIFVQRIDQWARPPGGLVCSHLGGIATVEAERFLVLTGGTRAKTDTSCDMSQDDGYDTFALGGTDPTANFLPASPTTPQTLVSLGSQMLAIVGDSASLIDLSGVNDPVVQAVPSPLKSFADVAGGAVILGTTSSFVVGATRTSSASQMVLEVSSDGSTLTAYELSAPRKGAAATWVQNANGGGFAGLVVAGGSATGAGVELLGATATATGFTTLPYMPIATVGASAVTDGSEGFFLFGGVDGTMPGPSWHMETTCNPCTPTPLTTTGLPSLPTVTGASAYSFSTGNGLNDLVVGTDATTGMIRSFILDVSNLPNVPITEVFLKEPRKGATVIASPIGTLALMGGQHADGTPALSVEMFRPHWFAQSPVLSN
jgi:hypothetical protein